MNIGPVFFSMHSWMVITFWIAWAHDWKWGQDLHYDFNFAQPHLQFCRTSSSIWSCPFWQSDIIHGRFWMKNVWNQKNRCWLMSASYRRCNHSLHLRQLQRENARKRDVGRERESERNAWKLPKQERHTCMPNYLRVKSLQGLAINLFHFCFSNMVTTSKLVDLHESRKRVQPVPCTTLGIVFNLSTEFRWICFSFLNSVPFASRDRRNCLICLLLFFGRMFLLHYSTLVHSDRVLSEKLNQIKEDSCPSVWIEFLVKLDAKMPHFDKWYRELPLKKSQVNW